MPLSPVPFFAPRLEFPMPVVVRIAGVNDVETTRRVTDEAFASVRSIYLPNALARAHLTTLAPTLERLVAESDGQIVGTVRFGIDEGCLRIVALAVLPAYRRQGVARALLVALLSFAQDQGCRALSLHTVVQTGNVPMFQRLGFRLLSERPDDYSVSPSGDPVTEAYMELELPSLDGDTSISARG